MTISVEDVEDMARERAALACDFGGAAKIYSTSGWVVEAMPPRVEELSGEKTVKEHKTVVVDSAVYRIVEDVEDISSTKSSVSSVPAIYKISTEVLSGGSTLHILHRLEAAC